MAIRYRFRAPFSMVPENASPKTLTGIVPTMMNQPRRASTVPRAAGSRSDRSHAVAMFHRSCRKYRRIAAIVPSCVTAVNAAPGSSQPRNAGTIRTWPVEETGSSSVAPCTMPRTIA